MEKLDCKGQACPLPVVNAKKGPLPAWARAP